MDNPKKFIKRDGINIFTIIRDPDCGQHSVLLNGESIYGGGEYDFHPGCWGGWCQKIGDFSCPGSFVNAVIVKYKIIKHKIVKKKMRFTDSGEWKKI